jgi:hypothetical protein
MARDPNIHPLRIRLTWRARLGCWEQGWPAGFWIEHIMSALAWPLLLALLILTFVKI